jgi:putative thioredoxin
MDTRGGQIDFQKEVIDLSLERPVLVDFWAAWCGPCRMLGPVLDQLAAEQQDRWTLVKVDTEANPDLAAQYHIRSIPHVKLFHKGTPIAEFSGALSRTAIVQWLDEHLPDPVRDAWHTLSAHLPSWPAERLPAALVDFVAAHPEHEEAALVLAQYQVLSDPGAVQQLVGGIPFGHPREQQAAHIAVVASWLTDTQDASHASGKALLEAKDAFLRGDMETCFRVLIDALMRDKNYEEGFIRRLLIALFQFRGETDPLVIKYRKFFAMALH